MKNAHPLGTLPKSDDPTVHDPTVGLITTWMGLRRRFQGISLIVSIRPFRTLATKVTTTHPAAVVPLKMVRGFHNFFGGCDLGTVKHTTCHIYVVVEKIVSWNLLTKTFLVKSLNISTKLHQVVFNKVLDFVCCDPWENDLWWFGKVHTSFNIWQSWVFIC